MAQLQVVFSDDNLRVAIGSLVATTLFYRRRDDDSLYMVVQDRTVPCAPPVPPSFPDVTMPVEAVKESRIQVVNLMTGILETIGSKTRVYLASGELVARAQENIG